MKRYIVISILLVLTAMLAAQTPPTVSNVNMIQQCANVQISYDLSAAQSCSVTLLISGDSGASYKIYPTRSLLSGDIGENVSPGIAKSIVWQISSEQQNIIGAHYRARVIARNTDELVDVSGGSFQAWSGFNPSVSNFSIGKYELTQTEWKAVMNSNPAQHSDGNQALRPVEQIHWYDTMVYCNLRSLQEGLVPCYSYDTYGSNPGDWPSGWNLDANSSKFSLNLLASGYRLPTEMENWFAARGGNLSHGYTYAGSNTIDNVAWYNRIGGSYTKNVGLKQANELGLYDLSGNMWEWVWDLYTSTNPSGTPVNYTGGTTGFRRIVRGGGWDNAAAKLVISNSRENHDADGINDVFGMRLVRRKYQ